MSNQKFIYHSNENIMTENKVKLNKEEEQLKQYIEKNIGEDETLTYCKNIKRDEICFKLTSESQGKRFVVVTSYYFDFNIDAVCKAVLEAFEKLKDGEEIVLKKEKS